ncbi:MAG: calcium-binding protein [Burkholderiales bacterium]
MTTIHDAYINALLADATYAFISNRENLSPEALILALTTRMTLPQATYIANNFTMVTHTDADDILGSGFDATVWQGNVGTPYAGKTYVSMTGTEGLQDFLTDADLATSGAASHQFVSMVNWWLKITAPANYSVMQIGLVEIYDNSVPPKVIGYEYQNATPVQGTGTLPGVTNVEVNGHSLGGFLASAFARLFGGGGGVGGKVGIGHVTTFNSAGFTGGSEFVFKEIEQLIGVGLGRLPNATEQTNYFANNGLNFTTNSFYFNQVGQRVSLYNEESASVINNHYMYKLTDALALGDFLATLDPTLDTTKLYRIYEASSNFNLNAVAFGTSDSALEKALDGLSKTLRAFDPHTPVGDIDLSAPSRAAFHDNLKVLKDSVSVSLAGKFTIEVSGNADTMSQEARTDFGTFLALNYLTPFVLKTTDVATTASLKSVQGSLATKWTDDRIDTATKEANGSLHFTEQWLKDRAMLAAAIIDSNQLDKAVITDIVYRSTKISKDLTTQRTVTYGPLIGNGSGSSMTIFGSDLAETGSDLDGGTGDDHIYGGGGNDTINGGVGKDYMEGNDGFDLLRGDDGNDTLLGGEGGDILKGGKGDDKLFGGEGSDTYEFATGDGNDTIIDSDGHGTITVDGILLNGGKQINDSAYVWKSDDGQFTYTLIYSGYTNDLFISRKDKSDTIVVKNYYTYGGQNLGITLNNADPQPTVPIGTSLENIVHPTSIQDVVDYDGLSGNDLIVGSLGNNRLFGGEGNDSLMGTAGEDYLDGGAGNDYFSGGAGKDTIFGGAGDDVITSINLDYTYIGNSYPDLHNWLGPWQKPDGVTFNSEETFRSNSPGTLVADNSLYMTIGGNANLRMFHESTTFIHQSYYHQMSDGVAAVLSFGIDENQNRTVGDIISGGAGNDQIGGSEGGDIISGDEGDDDIVGFGGDDSISGGGGADDIGGGDGNDVILGGGGIDELVGEYGNDHIEGGTGDDIIIGDFPVRDTGMPDAREDFSRNGEDYLDGGEGNDTIYGNGGSDALYGGTGDDDLRGDSPGIPSQYQGDDYLDGGDGNDKLIGHGGKDELFGGRGNDQLFGDSDQTAEADQNDDYLDGGDGFDFLRGYGGNDDLFGGAHNDELLGEIGDDYLDGESGDDSLDGGEGNDILAGGSGTDTLWGGDGNDTYLFNLGDGTDVIEDADFGNTIEFGPGINPEQVSAYYYAQGADERLVISYSDQDYVQIVNGRTSAIQTIKFADGTSQPVTAFFNHDVNAVGTNSGETFTTAGGNDSIVGGNGSDTIKGFAGNDKLWGEGGNDTLEGGAGDDQLVGGWGENNLYGGDGNDLLINGPDGVGLLDGGAGDDELQGGRFNDTLDGGAGNDKLYGGNGSEDTYIFKRGSGQDIIFDTGGWDWVHFQGLNSYDVTTTQDGSNVIFAINGTADTLTIVNQSVTINAIETFHYEDTQVSQAYIPNVVKNGTDGDDILSGNSGAFNTIDGQGGNDTLNGKEFKDILNGGNGNDQLFGIYGNDYLDGGADDDVLEGGSGNDILYGGSGFDRLVGDDSSGEGNDLLDGGDGNDIMFGDDDTAYSCYDFDGGGNDILRGGAGNDEMYGCGGNDVLEGGADNDYMIAGRGNDTLDGGTGNDYLDGGKGADIYFFGRGSGYDTIADRDELSNAVDRVRFAADISSNDVTVRRNGNDVTLDINGTTDSLRLAYFADSIDTRIERIEFADGTVWDPTYLLSFDFIGTPEDDSISGTSNSDKIYGLAGNDVLDGKGGADLLVGGLGDDFYWIYHGGEIITENANEGIDTVQSDASYTLGDNVENLLLYSYTGPTTGTGNALNNILHGSSWDDTLTGLAGNDTLDGGSGADTLIGGVGNDTYIVDDPLDVIIENANEGSDTIQTNVTYALSAGISIENITLGGTSAINATGDAGDNILIGNSAINTLTGGAGNDTLDGGAGSDKLIGGTGNDIYVVGSTGDLITENANEGTDTIQSSITLSLAATANVNVENLTLTGTAAINATGNALNNVLVGNSGNNVLNGGTGSDSMSGGAGDDTYVVDVATDIVSENLNEGTDTVQSAVVYSLGANVENLTLTGTATNGTGNALNNTLTGNASNNILDGGAGADTLIGGAGNDTYVVDDAGDLVTEALNAGTDTIQSSVTLSLTATSNANVENLTLTGTAAINGTGNALTNILTGNAGNNQLDGGAGNDSLIGGLGNDLYLFGRSYGQDIINDLDTTVGNIDTVRFASNVLSSEVTITRNTNDVILTINGTTDTLTLQGYNSSTANQIERVEFADGTVWGSAILSNPPVPPINGTAGNDILTGTANNDTMYGFAGDDQLNGGLGTDTMAGGVGNDTYTVDNIGDIVTENLNEGTDAVNSSVTYTIGANVENLTLTGTTAINATGNAGDNVLIGNSAANTLTGGAGNDSLNGGAGTDTMVGGAGNDSYTVDVATDVITELVNEGTDSVSSSVTYTLATNVENLTLTGTTAINGTGNASDNVLIGNSAINTLTGGAGNDTLDGGAGVDTMVGGAGNDTYVVDVATDVITELANEGTDTVSTGITYTLGTNVENLTLTGTAAINGTGNTLNNVITGNAANNTLDGGTGADTLIGGAGNDTYAVDNIVDIVTENLNEGTDAVNSSVTYTIGANVENLTLTGTTAINGTGNAGDNVLTGNSAANMLTGGTGNDSLNGGAGTDTMIGGLGNDSYTVDATTDVITENLNEGTDSVSSSVTYTLATNVENLTLTGTTAINGTGNATDNILIGNSAINTLTGGAGNDTLDGGAGADKLLGGLGNDSYVVDVATDVITENLNEGTDTVSTGITYTLGTNVENLTLTGAAAINATGNASDNVLIGNSAINTLTGAAGNDTLDGGAGADKLIGGLGNDIYVVDNVGDLITENANEGADTIQSSITLSLAATTNVNVENLTLTGGTTAINATGNALANTLIGNDGINILDGGAGNDTLNGGLGSDTLKGGAGSDTYLFNLGSGSDIIVEADATAGNTDIIQFGAGINQSQLVFKHIDNDLVVSITGSTDVLTIQGWYLGTANQVEQFKTADGLTLLAADIPARLSIAAAAPATALLIEPAPTQVTASASDANRVKITDPKTILMDSSLAPNNSNGRVVITDPVVIPLNDNLAKDNIDRRVTLDDPRPILFKPDLVPKPSDLRVSFTDPAPKAMANIINLNQFVSALQPTTGEEHSVADSINSMSQNQFASISLVSPWNLAASLLDAHIAATDLAGLGEDNNIDQLFAVNAGMLSQGGQGAQAGNLVQTKAMNRLEGLKEGQDRLVA